jgi:hypothetical protein
MSNATGPRDDALDKTLRRLFAPSPADGAGALHVLSKFNGALPPQKPRFALWPRFLLNPEFAPAWPRVAALACSIALGFAVGLSGIDRQLQGGAYSVASSSDFASAISEPEPLTGLRP